MNSLLKFKYSIKIQNKSLVFSIVLYFITCIFLIIFADSWEFVKLTSVLIPIILCTNVLSKEYENKMEGMILLNSTPIHKIVFSRYWYSFFTSQVIVFLLFLIALITNEINGEILIKHFIIISIYSLLLTFLGLLISNITKNTIYGYSVPIAYFIFQIVAGNFIFGKYCPILATSYNLTLKNHIIISNIFFMLISSIILYVINLLYICTEKNI